MALRMGVVEIAAVSHKAWEWCRIAHAMNREVVFFTRREFVPRIREELGPLSDEVCFVTTRPRETVGAFLCRVSRECSVACEVVIANTLGTGWFAWFRPACPFFGVVYDMNFWFRDSRSFPRYLRNLTSLRNLVLPIPFRNAFTSIPLRRRILKKLSGVIVEYPNFVGLVRDRWGVTQPPVFFFPRRCYAGAGPVVPSDRLRVVIPGAVERLRRDYDTVVRAFETMPKVGLRRCSVGLLGSVVGTYGRRIVARLSALKSEGLELFCAEEFVPTAEFERRMREADLILAPLQAELIDGMRRETYSITKGSGCFDDSVRFGKPSVVPSFYEEPPELAEGYRKYRDSDELSRLLTDLALTPAEATAWRATSDRLLSRYSPENLAAQFAAMMRHIEAAGINSPTKAR